MKPLGKLARVQPRSVWPHEAADFTPWLAENLAALGETLGLDLELVERESGVGDFSADIIAQESGTDRVVVIENQLEATDHSHLGQLLTYAAGKKARAVVWISPEPREEHREVIDWLNEGSLGAEFYLVALEVLQIDSSKPAVNFRLVAFPNDWVREQRGDAQPSERMEAYRDFYQPLLDELRQRGFTNARAAQAQSWYAFSAGTSGFAYSAAFTAKGQLRAELYLGAPDRDLNKATFDRLAANRAALDAAFGASLTWDRLETKKACRVAILRDASIEDAPEALAAHRAWLIEKLLKLKQVFGPHLNPEPAEPGAAQGVG
ncbi:MAG: DUF4268 domain-containing protein [Deltaproteobacteria bacterium]|nr:DUF4268 domain-containing protein [Deltaproteobacteria bacterium]